MTKTSGPHVTADERIEEGTGLISGQFSTSSEAEFVNLAWKTEETEEDEKRSWIRLAAPAVSRWHLENPF